MWLGAGCGELMTLLIYCKWQMQIVLQNFRSKKKISRNMLHWTGELQCMRVVWIGAGRSDVEKVMGVKLAWSHQIRQLQRGLCFTASSGNTWTPLLGLASTGGLQAGRTELCLDKVSCLIILAICVFTSQKTAKEMFETLLGCIEHTRCVLLLLMIT